MSQATLGSSAYRNSGLFSRYYLDDRIEDLEEWECDDEAEAAFTQLTDLWKSESDLLSSYKEDELLGSWIDEILAVLGYDTLQETTLPGGDGYNDRLLFESTETRRKASRRKREDDVEGMYGLSSAILEAKQYEADFTEKFDERRSYHDASHQIRFYLDRAGGQVDWGILTNGKQWRLYGTKDYETEIYYEVDLESLLRQGDLEEFKYFYAFFRPEAFQRVAGTTFLDTVWNESETAAQELGEDLQDNVFTALRILGEGFVETNDLQIGTDSAADIDADELKEQSLVLLYRLMFVLYAESRSLMQPDDPEDKAEYDENFSLNQLRLEIDDRISSGDSYTDYSSYSTTIWSQLQDLFTLVDIGNDTLGVPAYNGGLFDAEEHRFLAENEVSDPYITEVIHRLGTTETDNGESVLADYADLDTRHLGTIYEGLLEHKFQIAPEQYAAITEDGGQIWKPATEVSVANAIESVDEGDLYVVNDDGERKTTGAYYTPNYVVSYIVEETIDPLLEDIKFRLKRDGLDPSDPVYFGQFYSQLLDLKILDPAMGSAHFLTSATGYLTEQVMEIVREQELQGRNEQELRRTIAKECIYGVDVNGMAVELGKLSMWLETLATDKPLAFLDHHIKTGNSLVGSDITEVLSEDGSDTEGQLTLTQSFARARQKTLGHIMELMTDLLAIENDELADIKSMEKLYDQIRGDPLYQRLLEVANVHTAARFGANVPDDAYEEMAGAINHASEWKEIRSRDWFAAAQATAQEQNAFHWELEYPEVFFDENGEKRNEAGFDALIGNPPWVRSINLKQANESNWRYLKENYETAKSGEYDIYLCFTELGLSLTNTNGEFGYITPNKWFTSNVGENLRRMLSKENYLTEVIDFGSHQLFDGITTYSSLIFLNRKNTDEISVSKLEDYEGDKNPEIGNDQFWQSGIVASDSISEESWSFNIGPVGNLFDRLEELPKLGDHANIFKGVGTNADTVYLLENTQNGLYSKELDEVIDIEKGILRPALKGTDIDSYHYERDHTLVFPYIINNGDVELLAQDRLKQDYPQAWRYFERVQETLESRESGKYRGDYDWYRFGRPQNMTLLSQEKVVLPDVVDESTLAFDSEGRYILDTAYGIVSNKFNEKYLTSIINTDLLTNFLQLTGTDLRGGYFRMKTAYLDPFPIPNMDFTTPDVERESRLSELESKYHGYLQKDSSKPLPVRDDVAHDFLAKLTDKISKIERKYYNLNLNVLDHLGNYSPGQSLNHVGLTQPSVGSADSILQATSETYPNLRVGTAVILRESSSTVEVQLTARYKPQQLEDVSGPVDDREADRWGYVETDLETAIRITDLTKTEADLVETFVPVAIDEAGGFANFRETATKTNSLTDRLHKLTLPAVSDVETGLESYMQTKQRAEELERKIEQTDDLIDEIVYELYGLTDEEIEIVEESVSE